MVRSAPVMVTRQFTSPALTPSGGTVERSRTGGRVKRNSSQYTRASPAKIAMGMTSGLPVR